ncbi:MAG TPA: biopolymer transporter ExbD [Thermoanaerobaculaceae bacterium]|nr:biopolymer transporter ExbD [Thermoanaerobaculaceae bacterium]
MAMTPGSRSRSKSEINVTPLVDVVLVLLIIFMVVTPVLRAGHDAAIPPSAERGPDRQPADQLVVRLEADGGVFINSERVEPGYLAERLRQVLRGRGGLPTFVAAADAVPYQRVMGLMDACRDAGAANLAIVLNDLTPR